MQKVKISELPLCTDFTGLFTIGATVTGSGNASVRVSLDAVGEAVSSAEEAANNANSAATNANSAAAGAEEAATGAGSAAEAANEAADRANKAAENAEGSTDLRPITEEEIDGLLENFRFLDTFTVTAEGTYPLALKAESTAEGADITGSVDISEIDDADIRGAFGES